MDLRRSRVAHARRSLSGVIGGTVFAMALIVAAPAAFAAPPGANCQPFTSKPCLLPFPNNLYTVKDPSSATGRRVHLPREAMPTNTEGSRVRVGPYNRNDGFSPGSAMVARVPGLDNPAALQQTNPP
jgi:hypothetical protein